MLSRCQVIQMQKAPAASDAIFCSNGGTNFRQKTKKKPKRKKAERKPCREKAAKHFQDGKVK